ncbi:hypothetical protein L1887_44321 [Cichorium endivia]|nr:hypothetical protein L1887_44321 [Cichorium endivia]
MIEDMNRSIDTIEEELRRFLSSLFSDDKSKSADHGAGSQAIPEVVCKKGISIEGWKFPSPGGVSVSVGERQGNKGKAAGRVSELGESPSLHSLERRDHLQSSCKINWESAASEFCFTLLYFISEFANKGTGGMFSRHKAWGKKPTRE